jgi:PAS domain S-box-containing protein
MEIPTPERELVAANEALKRKSEELWQQREQFRVTLASIGDGVITTDTQGTITFMNPVAEAMTGWSQSDALGRPLEEVFSIVNEETRGPVPHPVQEVLRTGTVVGLASSTSLIRKDGATVSIEDSAAPIRDTTGNISGCVIVFHDVTQRRRAERAQRANEDRLRDSARRLQLAMSAGDMGDWVWDAETNLMSLSPRAAQLFSLPPNVPVSRDQLRARVPPEDGVRTKLEFDRALLEKTDYRVEFRIVRSNGTLTWVAARGRGVYADNGTVVGMIGMVQDITERRQAEETMRETDRRKDEFLATLAHELRNPLAPIRQATLIAQSPGATEAQKRWSHEVINRQVHTMALLLDDLLEISRITRGTLALRTQLTELTTIVDAAVETARPLIDTKRHTLSLQLPAERIEFTADPMRLAQVLSNLLTNAAKYTDPDGRIGLSAACDAGMITISVTDTGIGIPPDAMGKMFSMFTQVKSGKDRSEGGLGIGLALAKGLVELHGGTIEARSAGNERGSEFIIRLPVRTQRIRQPEESPRPGAERILRRRVLIADDNRDAAESLAMLLEMEGHEVTVVHDGREAVTAFDRMRPDAALLDIGMPGLNGYEIARIIRRAPHGRDVTLIAVTGWGQDNDKAQATEAGFNHHFTKPVEPDAITALLAGASPNDK